MLRSLCRSVARGAAILIATGSAALAEDVAVTDCDRLAANFYDPDAVAPAVFTNEMDIPAALAACEAAVADDPGTARLRFQLARTLFAADRPEEALAQLTLAAEAAYPAAPWLFAAAYTYGWGVEADAETARDWFLRAADLGHPQSQAYVCHNTAQGGLIEKDPQAALDLCRASAEAGDRQGMIVLARLYQAGEGIEQDLDAAALWYRRSADLSLGIAADYPNQVQFVDWAAWSTYFANEAVPGSAPVDRALAALDAALDRTWTVAPDPFLGSAAALRTEMRDVKAHLLEQNGDREAALALYKTVLNQSAQRAKRMQGNLADKGFYDGEVDGLVTDALIAALEACVRQGDCYP